MTAAVALPFPRDAFLDNEPICPACVTTQGLCHAEWCRRQVLPQPARSPLLRMIAETRVEQKKRQITPPKESTAIEKVKRRNARKEERLGSASMADQVAFMGRRKLLRAIMERKG